MMTKVIGFILLLMFRRAKMKKILAVLVIIPTVLVLGVWCAPFARADVVKIGINYPQKGPYRVQGLNQIRAARLAVEEINAEGGILGKKIVLVERDSKSKPGITTRNVTELIDAEGVKMVFGGSSSAVAVAAGKVCQLKGVPFFGTLTYSTATTGKEARRHVFRECYNAWMGAKVIASYLKKNFPAESNKYFYITADYTWGHTTEASVRELTGTTNKMNHKSVLTPFPGAKYKDFQAALKAAQKANPKVLVLVLFGRDMVDALNVATAWGIKQSTQVVVPNLTLGMAEYAGPDVMEGTIGAVPWSWKVPYQYNYPQGKKFVEKFAARYGKYPSTSGASAYTILYEYKSAVERAGTYDSAAVVKALEGHQYQLLKDKQVWRDFDHQSVQTVYAVKCKPKSEVRQDKYFLDYFEIISRLSGEEAVRTRQEWNAVRIAANKPIELEKLSGE